MKSDFGAQIVQENEALDWKAIAESLLGVFNSLAENVLLNQAEDGHESC